MTDQPQKADDATAPSTNADPVMPTASEAETVMPGASFLSAEDRARIARLTSSNDARFKSDAQNQAVLERAKRLFRAMFMRADHGRWRISKSKALAYLTAGAAAVAFWNYWPRPHLENAFDAPAISLGSSVAGQNGTTQASSSPASPNQDLGITAPPKMPAAQLESKPTEPIANAMQPNDTADSSLIVPSTTYSPPMATESYAAPVATPNPLPIQTQPISQSDFSSPSLIPSSVPGVTPATTGQVPRVAPAPMALVKREPVPVSPPLPLITATSRRTMPEPSSLVSVASSSQTEPNSLVSPNPRAQAEPTGLVNVTSAPRPEPVQVAVPKQQPQNTFEAVALFEAQPKRPSQVTSSTEPSPLIAARVQTQTAPVQVPVGQAGVVLEVQNRREVTSNQTVPNQPIPLQASGEARGNAAQSNGVLFDRANAAVPQASDATPISVSGSSQTKPQSTPYPPGTRVNAKFVTGVIVIAGREAPVVMALEDGTVAFGKASLNETNRVQITVLEVVKGDASSAVNGSGLALDGFPGLLGQVREDGADVVSKLWNAALSGVSSYVQGLANASTTTFGQGVTTVSQPGAELGWSVLGNLAQAFLTPPAQQQTVKYVELKPDTPFQVLFMPVR